MTVGLNVLRSLKVPLVYLRTGYVRWFEAVNSNFQSILHTYSCHIRRNYHTSGASSTYYGRLVCRDPNSAGTSMDRVTDADPNTASIKYPTQAFYTPSVAGSTDEWYARTIGMVQLSGGHAQTPGTIAYLDAANPGKPTSNSASGVIVGVFCSSPYLLFLPHT